MRVRTRQRTAAQTLSALALLGMLLLPAPDAAAAPASASAQAERATQSLLERADFLMASTYREFPAYARQREAPFDWDTDGCSRPTPQAWATVFRDACVMHDFGYHNYGNRGTTRLRLDPTETRRKAIDDRFLQEMQRICDDRPQTLANCQGAARTMHQAVRQYAGSAFY
ncbi:phospholipase A2 [Streptomyces ehimensis]|uniref:Phospholipase A2 n=1 Tax=Streptomyces ehimensis TaxID=68195 RepID=A0ABV9BT44_9ACTN